MSQNLGVRPSDLLGIGKYEDDPVPFWFDRAITRFGRMVESDVEKRAQREKTDQAAQSAAHQRLMQWLDFDGTLTKQRFAAPPITKRKVME